jgi:hypothetical protein
MDSEKRGPTRRRGRGWLPKRSNCKGPFGPPCAVTPLGTRPSDARFPCSPAFRARRGEYEKDKVSLRFATCLCRFPCRPSKCKRAFCSNRFHRRTMPRRRPSAAGTGPSLRRKLTARDAVAWLSRRSAPSVARERSCETFRRVPVPAFARSRAAWRRTAPEAFPFLGTGSLTPARRALDRPIAIACWTDLAPWTPSRT